MWTPTLAEAEILLLSLKVAAVSVVFSLPCGLLVAWFLARRRFPGRTALDALVHLPLILPPVVVGYLLLLFLGRNGIVGAWLYEVFGITIAFTWKGAAIASAVMGFPLMVRAIRLSLEGVDRGFESAARTLGAGPVRVFMTVTLPLILPGVLSGTILAFARSLGEFGATIAFVSNIPGETRTLPLALFTAIQSASGDATAARLVVISVVLALVTLIASEVMARRITVRFGA
jgi:molybdate transport system permease protein